MNSFTLTQSTESDLDALLRVEAQSFGEEAGAEIAELVNALLDDPSAEPRLSLLAIRNEEAVGYILFTKAEILSADQPVSAAILAPLAVVPEAQSQGIGGQLVREGLRLLSESGVELVFVLGHPGYYPRFGFRPAGELGFEAPYPIPEEAANAWMVQELCPGVIGRVRGIVACADALDRPEYWRE
jgi:putative acetyltransferase